MTHVVASSVSVYRVDSVTGALSEAPENVCATGGGGVSIAIDPSGKFAYIANGSFNNVSAYTINAKIGALKPIPGSPYSTGHRTNSVAYSVTVDPTGKFVYATTGGFKYGAGHNIWAFRINHRTGALTAVTRSPFSAGDAASAVMVSK